MKKRQTTKCYHIFQRLFTCGKINKNKVKNAQPDNE